MHRRWLSTFCAEALNGRIIWCKRPNRNSHFLSLAFFPSFHFYDIEKKKTTSIGGSQYVGQVICICCHLEAVCIKYIFCVHKLLINQIVCNDTNPLFACQPSLLQRLRPPPLEHSQLSVCSSQAHNACREDTQSNSEVLIPCGRVIYQYLVALLWHFSTTACDFIRLYSMSVCVCGRALSSSPLSFPL